MNHKNTDKNYVDYSTQVVLAFSDSHENQKYILRMSNQQEKLFFSKLSIIESYS